MMKAYLMIFGLLLVCSGAALAQGTPDWMTPSEETICDGETGAAFGLCNAYCEAMDCDSPNAQASATACSKVSDKFTNITGRPLPCDACPLPPPGTTCPCDQFEDWGLVLNADGGTCGSFGTVALKGVDDVGVLFATCSLGPVTGGACAGEGAGNFSFLLDITPEEGSACFYQILDSCNPE